jgi:hypothetical protein
MSDLLTLVVDSLRETVLAVAPIAVILVVFQRFVLRRALVDVRNIILGFVLVVVGMAVFLTGLREALFPLGRVMAEQLTRPELIGVDPQTARWSDYGWVYAFGACVGFATTLAEPALIAVAIKASEVSAGTINAWGLRISVATGVAIGIAVGCLRIVTGTPLPAYIIAGYVVVALLSWKAPSPVLALAFDTGGVTTSTVTVPLVAALGLGLASTIPGRSPLVDGFGLIAFASLFPMVTVLLHAHLAARRAHRLTRPPVRNPQEV